MADPTEMLAAGENVLLAGRRHPASMWRAFLAAGAVAALGLWVDGSGARELLEPMAALAWRAATLAGRDPAAVVWVVAHAGKGLLVGGALGALWTAMSCSASVYVVTPRRVLACRGLLSREVSEMTGRTIRSVELRRGVVGSAFGYGTVVIHGFAMDRVYLQGAPSPLAFLRAIEEVQL